jgi:hypothetical protein
VVEEKGRDREARMAEPDETQRDCAFGHSMRKRVSRLRKSVMNKRMSHSTRSARLSYACPSQPSMPPLSAPNGCPVYPRTGPSTASPFPSQVITNPQHRTRNRPTSYPHPQPFQVPPSINPISLRPPAWARQTLRS